LGSIVIHVVLVLVLMLMLIVLVIDITMMVVVIYLEINSIVIFMAGGGRVVMLGPKLMVIIVMIMI